MAIVKHHDTIADSATGRPIAGAVVQVFDYPSEANAVMYDAIGGVSTAPVVTDSNGSYSFYVENGHYNITYYHGGITRRMVDVLVGGAQGPVGPASSGYTLVSTNALAAAVAAAGSTPTTIAFSVNQTLLADFDCPANIDLLPVNNTKINHGAYAFTYAGSTAKWGTAQVLNGTGSVLLSGTREVRADWFWDKVADPALAINKAIMSFGTFATRLSGISGVVQLDNPQYYTQSTIYLFRPVLLRGNGGSYLYPGTEIIAPPGVTGIRVATMKVGGFNSPDNIGAPFAWMEHIKITTSGKLTTTTTGTYNTGTFTVALADALDFVNGQTICVRGAGLSQTYPNVTGTIANGSNQLTISIAKAAIPNGGVLALAGGALPAGTYVVSQSGAVLTLSANATADATGAAITLYNDLYADVISGGGTTTLTIDNGNNGGTSVVGATVSHADSGINAKATFSAQDVSVIGFAGAGIFVRGGSTDAPGSNTNVSQITGGFFTSNKIGILFSGADSNAGTVIGANALTNTQWAFLDESLLGNTWIGTHAAGGYGFKSTGGQNLAMMFGGYTESSTYNIFAPNSMMVGRGATPHAGGGQMGSTGNALRIGDYYLGDKGFTTSQKMILHTAGTGPVTTSLSLGTVVENHTPAASTNPLVSSVKLTNGTGGTVGDHWMQVFGTFRKLETWGTAVPTTGARTKGDIHWNTNPTAAIPTAYWLRVTTDATGTAHVLGTDWIAK